MPLARFLARTHCCIVAHHVWRQCLADHPLQQSQSMYTLLALPTNTDCCTVAHNTRIRPPTWHLSEQPKSRDPICSPAAHHNGFNASLRNYCTFVHLSNQSMLVVPRSLACRRNPSCTIMPHLGGPTATTVLPNPPASPTVAAAIAPATAPATTQAAAHVNA